VHASSRRRRANSTAASRGGGGGTLGALFSAGGHPDETAAQRSRSLACSIKEAVVGNSNPRRGPSRGPPGTGHRKLSNSYPMDGLAAGVDLDGFAASIHEDEIAQATGNSHCSINAAPDPNAEIRTKVFRMGAPLLRSTIPLTLGSPRTNEARLRAAAEEKVRRQAAGEEDSDDEGSDVETVLSLCDVGIDDLGALSVTLDFPC